MLYELGSQSRRSSNAVAANIAEGWNNRRSSIYVEAINRAMGELQETLHQLAMAFQKQYLSRQDYEGYLD